MEYFDFDHASLGSQQQDDDIASDILELDESDAVANYESLFFEKNFSLPTQTPDPPFQYGDCGNEDGDPSLAGLENQRWPMDRAKEPCDRCRTRGLDCFLARRGVMQNDGCTCCISLYRQCSFTHKKPQGKFLDTLHVVDEDTLVHTGGLTGKKALRSLNGGANFDDFEGKGRKNGARFARDAVKVLKKWLSEHTHHPYPTEEEKEQLEQLTGLKKSQVSNWLANARRRGKVRPASHGSSPGQTGAISIPAKPLPPGVDMADLNPLDRWKYSPPENEAASTTAIARAMASTPFPEKTTPGYTQARSQSRKTGSSNDSSLTNSNMFQAPSLSSLDTTHTTHSSISDMSFASAFSHRSSLGSFNSMERKERRRRRQKLVGPKNAFQSTKTARIFQCTFCTDSFATKYDWQRHEKSLHLALDKWTCAPQGGVLSHNGKKLCAFCRASDPDEDHMWSHNFEACQEKTVQERTFYRKDHLNQHLRLMHNVKFEAWMDQWKSTTNEIKSGCGFCPTVFKTWKDRTDHLAAHFKSGADMSQWTGDWGFEPFVHRLVENAMPPYLIAEDRRTIDPFVARADGKHNCQLFTDRQSSSASRTLPFPRDMNCFQRLQRELTAFVSRQLEVGVVPTDLMLQNAARVAVYGTDDPWNQTCADNPTWLAVLKRDNGIGGDADSEHRHLPDLGMLPPYAAHGGLLQPPMASNSAGITSVRRTSSLQSQDLPGLGSPGFTSSGFDSPAFPPEASGFHSAAHSRPTSFVGSTAGSIGVSSATAAMHSAAPACSSHRLSLPADFSDHFATSAPVYGIDDPLMDMDFDPEFVNCLVKELPDLNTGDLAGLSTFDPKLGVAMGPAMTESSPESRPYVSSSRPSSSGLSFTPEPRSAQVSHVSALSQSLHQQGVSAFDHGRPFHT